VSALGYYLERAGIATTGISLVREHTAQLQPPRSLWVSFPLGRPLGIPNDAEFQHAVIKAALELFEEASGPVLRDYPIDAPEVAIESAPACPVNFQRQSGSWQDRLASELALISPWYEIGLDKRAGRTLVGASTSHIHEILQRFGEDLDAHRIPADLKWFKASIEDAKTYYLEALSAEPGQHNARQLYRKLWHETELGRALGLFHAMFMDHPQRAGFARILLPRDAQSRIDDTLS